MKKRLLAVLQDLWFNATQFAGGDQESILQCMHFVVVCAQIVVIWWTGNELQHDKLTVLLIQHDTAESLPTSGNAYDAAW